MAAARPGGRLLAFSSVGAALLKTSVADTSALCATESATLELIERGDRMLGTSEITNLQRAKRDFHAFVAEHRKSQTQQDDAAQANLPLVEQMEVSRSDAMNVFFELHPEHKVYQIELAQVCRSELVFLFSKERWAATSVELSTKIPQVPHGD